MRRGDVVDGRYEVNQLIGQGGMGDVYLATQLKLQTQVALKVLKSPGGASPELIEQFLREARLLSSLSHGNIARVVDFFDYCGSPVLVMEYIRGQTLRDFVIRNGPVREDKVLFYARQILDALDYLHSQNPAVVVRDLNPQNLILTPDDKLVLIDFGIARTLDPGQQTETIIRGMGTEGYAPLEQYGRGITDQRTDIYALGGTMFFLLTGQDPPEAASRFAQGTELVITTRGNQIRSDTVEVVKSMLSLSPQDRPSSVAQVRKALTAVTKTAQLGTGSLRNSTGAPPLGHRIRVFASIGLLVVAFCLIYAGVTWEAAPGGPKSSASSVAVAGADEHVEGTEDSQSEDGRWHWRKAEGSGSFEGLLVDCDVTGNAFGSVTVRNGGESRSFSYSYRATTFPRGRPSPDDINAIDARVKWGEDGTVLVVDRLDPDIPVKTLEGFTLSGVYPGQTAEDVAKTLGPPDQLDHSNSAAVWDAEGVGVQFWGERVIRVQGFRLKAGGEVVVERGMPFQEVKNRLGEPFRTLSSEGNFEENFSCNFTVSTSRILNLADNRAGEKWLMPDDQIPGSAWITFVARKVDVIKLDINGWHDPDGLGSRMLGNPERFPPAGLGAVSPAVTADGRRFARALLEADVQAVEMLLKDEPTLVDAPLPEEDGRNPLHLALLGAGVPPQGRPLPLATRRAYAEISIILIARGANVNKVEGELNATPLHCAVIGNSVDLAGVLIEEGADLESPFGARGQTVLHLACTDDYTDMVRMLVRHGADVNTQDLLGATPLHCTRLPEIAEILISAGADLQAKARDGTTPLGAAETEGFGELVTFLRAQGAR